MAIIIQQTPEQLNKSNSDLLWVVTSVSASQPQFQYVCALQDGCGNTLTTIKQQPNPSNKGVFNLGRIVKQYLDYDLYALDIGTPGGLFNKQSQTAKFFKVAFGEEYGTSPSSSVTEYTGIGGATGSAAQTGSIPYYYFFNGVVDPNDGSFNWNTSSYWFPNEPTPSSATFSRNIALTDAPRTQYAQDGDYLSIAFLNGNLDESTTTAQDVRWVEYTFYSASVAYSSASFSNTNNTNTTDSGGPVTQSAGLFSTAATIQTCSTASGFQTSGSLLIHLGIGPQNLVDNGNVDGITGSWDYYTVKLYPQDSVQTGFFNPNGVWETITIQKQDPYCEYPGVRFAFINDYGVWDYFNFTLQEDKATNLESGNYKKNFVNYSTTTNSVTYDKKRRGTNPYYINITQTFRANSDWLTQAQADWLAQLFYSPNVYIQDGTTWVPIVITDTQFNAKTNPRTQKNFQYVVNYTLANNKRAR
jgi:hypothetical protein